MGRFSPLQLALTGLVLLVIGFLLPFLMVLRLVEPTLLLNFIAYLSSVVGLAVGVIGIAMFGIARPRDKE